MEDEETIENIFGFEDLSETESVTGPIAVDEVTENNTLQNAGQAPPPPKKKYDRKILPKLDSDVLTSDKGFSKLQQLISKTQFKKGKGHERENLRRLIEIYQLWGHNLYPRLKFKSIIERAEKLCTEKRLRVAYSRWREENRYRKKYETDEYNESGIIRDIDSDDNSNSMEVDGLNPFSFTTSTTTTSSTTAANTSTTSIISNTSFNNYPSFSSFINNNNNTNNNNSNNNSFSTSSSTVMSEADRAFMLANRERALKKLREKREALRKQKEEQERLQQQQQQQPSEPQAQQELQPKEPQQPSIL